MTTAACELRLAIQTNRIGFRHYFERKQRSRITVREPHGGRIPNCGLYHLEREVFFRDGP